VVGAGAVEVSVGEPSGGVVGVVVAAAGPGVDEGTGARVDEVHGGAPGGVLGDVVAGEEGAGGGVGGVGAGQGAGAVGAGRGDGQGGGVAVADGVEATGGVVADRGLLGAVD